MTSRYLLSAIMVMAVIYALFYVMERNWIAFPLWLIVASLASILIVLIENS